MCVDILTKTMASFATAESRRKKLVNMKKEENQDKIDAN
jgi:hypothetical protein